MKKYERGDRVRIRTEREWKDLLFDCNGMEGTVTDYDPSGKYGWVRVSLVSGLQHTFPNSEVELVKRQAVVEETG